MCSAYGYNPFTAILRALGNTLCRLPLLPLSLSLAPVSIDTYFVQSMADESHAAVSFSAVLTTPNNIFSDHRGHILSSWFDRHSSGMGASYVHLAMILHANCLTI